MRAFKTYVPSSALFIFLVAVLLLSRGLIVELNVHDVFFVVDASWRSYSGQTPHIDFETSIGQAFYWPYYVASNLAGPSILNVLHANLLVGALILLLGFAVLPARFPPLILFLCLGLAVVTAMTGRSVDEGVFTYDHLAPYNRWGWSFAIIGALTATVPPRVPGRMQDTLDAVCLAIALSVLYYLKISFFIPVFGLTTGAVLLRVLKLKTFLITLACLAALMLAVEAAFGNNLQYLNDLHRAAAINLSEGRGLLRDTKALFSFLVGGVFGIGALLILFAAGPLERPKAWMQMWWQTIAIVSLVIGAAAVARIQNHPRWEIAMFGAALLVAAELGRRKATELQAKAVPGELSLGLLSWRAGIAAAVILFGVATVMVRDAASAFSHMVESRRAAHCLSPALRGTPMERLVFPRANLLVSTAGGEGSCSDIATKPFGKEPLASDAAEYRRLLRTITLLRQHVRPGDVILLLDFANPYPFIFRSPAPRGAVAWWDRGRTFSAKIHPDPAALLHGADFVIQTDYAVQMPEPWPGPLARLRAYLKPVADNELGTGQDLWAIYGPAVRERFHPIARTGEATIWQKFELKTDGRP